MKNTLLSLLLLAATVLTAAGEGSPVDSAWERANAAYIAGQYDTAIELYDSIRTAGYIGPKLYYNLGNAYFKHNMVGKSIINYNRALRLAPSDADIKHNLMYANMFVKDKIEVVPEFFLTTWVRKVRQGISSDGWAVLSLVFVACMFGAILLYLLSRRMRYRKTGFYAAIIALALGIFSVYCASVQKKEFVNSGEAIVMSGAVSVKSSPDNSSKELFILHEGTKVKILGALNQWLEVSLADGKKGWLHETSIEII